MTSVTLASGAVNSSADLALKVNGTTTVVSLNTSGAIGVGSTPDYGSSGYILTSNGPTATPVWSSTFNGIATTTTTAAIGDNSTRIASTAFVSATAFNAALPAQAGNAGKFVTTNGTTASWATIVVPDFLLYAQGII